jgi:predicted P-loop ATPase
MSPWGKNEWRPFEEEDYVTLREHMERKIFKTVGREVTRDVVRKIAKENAFDSAKLWINGLEWDGVMRVSGFMENYFKTEKGKYSAAVSDYMWTALAGRALVPGVKADMVPSIIGKQGAGKTFGVSEMSPHPDYTGTIDLTRDDDAIARSVRGMLVLEIGEMKGVYGMDQERLKQTITKRIERWTPKFCELNTSYPRRCLFIGTGNDKMFLRDPTGNRRWLPIECGSVDVERIKETREQLWAEAATMFKTNGVMYQEAERLAPSKHKDFRAPDFLAEKLNLWLDTNDSSTGDINRNRKYLLTSDIFQNGLELTAEKFISAKENKLGQMMREEGFDYKVVWENGKAIRAWVNLQKITS